MILNHKKLFSLDKHLLIIYDAENFPYQDILSFTIKEKSDMTTTMNPTCISKENI